MSRDEDLGLIVDRPNAERAAVILEEEIEAREELERRKVFRLIRDGALDPQQAVQSWVALEQMDALRSRLEKRIRMAQSAGQRRAGDMNSGIGKT